METTNIRIQAGEEFYQALLQEQKKRHRRSGKRIGLGSIIVEICNSYLFPAAFDQNPVQREPGSDQYTVQNVAGIDQNKGQNGTLRTEMTLERNLEGIRSLEKYLIAREEALIRRERDLAERAERLQIETDKFFDDKAAFLDQKLENQNISIDGVIEARISHDLAQKELSTKNEQMRTLKDEIEYLRKQLEKSQATETKKEDRSLMDKLMPFLPSIITVVGMFLMSKKFDPQNDQDPVQKEINKVFKSLDPKNREALTKALREAIGQYSGTLPASDQKKVPETDQKDK